MTYIIECVTKQCEAGRRPCPTPTRCGRYVAEASTEVGADDDYQPTDWRFVKFCAFVMGVGLVLFVTMVTMLHISK